MFVLKIHTKVKHSVEKEATANRRPEMESFSAHFNPDNLGIVGSLLVMGVTQVLTTHPVMGPVCQRWVN